MYYKNNPSRDFNMLTQRIAKLVGRSFLGLIFMHCADAETLELLLPLPTTINENPEKVVLGERLFYEKKLSKNGKRACIDCHPLDNAGMDGKIRANATDGISILRNTPTIFNVSFNYFFNWDGVVSTLETHTERVLLNPKVMDTDWPSLLTTQTTEKTYQ